MPALNAMVHAFQNVPVRKWEEFLSRGGDTKKPRPLAESREAAAQVSREVSPAAP